jgi:hypothetical protein
VLGLQVDGINRVNEQGGGFVVEIKGGLVDWFFIYIYFFYFLLKVFFFGF